MIKVIICNTIEIKKTEYIKFLYFIKNISNEYQSGIIVGVFGMPERKNLCVCVCVRERERERERERQRQRETETETERDRDRDRERDIDRERDQDSIY